MLYRRKQILRRLLFPINPDDLTANVRVPGNCLPFCAVRGQVDGSLSNPETGEGCFQWRLRIFEETLVLRGASKSGYWLVRRIRWLTVWTPRFQPG